MLNAIYLCCWNSSRSRYAVSACFVLLKISSKLLSLSKGIFNQLINIYSISSYLRRPRLMKFYLSYQNQPRNCALGYQGARKGVSKRTRASML
jgi:hypothetical protein